MIKQSLFRMSIKPEFNQLLTLLGKAQELSSQYTGGYSEHFFSAEEFHAELKKSIQNLKAGELNELSNLQLYFIPTSDWDDFIGFEGMDLANEIFEIISELIKQNP